MRQCCTALWTSILLVAAAMAVAPAPIAAQTQAGVRAGVSANPDQFYFGGHIETTPLVDRLRFRPNVEVGVGDNLTLVAVNFEFIYPFASRQPWHVYAGAGPALNWFRSNGVSDSGAGLNLLLGLEHRNGVFFEAKIGTFDSPDLKFGVGYTFR
jgi:hypothetical protein